MSDAESIETMLPEEDMPLVGPDHKFLGLWDFREKWEYFYRNSYRCRKCHIYETVKLNQIELSNQSITVKVKKDLKLSLNMI